MRLVDFLIALLNTHAQTLQRLAALFGEEWLMDMLEHAADGDEGAAAAKPNPEAADGSRVRLDLFEAGPAHGAQASAYASLESSVHDLQLPAVLEFHLWAYPYYRTFIESPLDMNARLISGPGSEQAAEELVDDAIAHAQSWVKKLPIPPDLGKQAEAAANVPWLRFRADILRRTGRRPLGAV